MNCLKVRDIYEYLEGDLSFAQRADIENHLKACPNCRRGMEERKALAEAASGLPPLEVPADFAERVMARISPARVSLRAWLIALLAAFSILAAALAILLLSGKNLLASLSTLNNSLWGLAKNAAVFLGKAAALLSQAGTIIRAFSEVAAKGMGILTDLLSFEAQIAIVALLVFIGITVLYAIKKKIIIWGK